MIRFVFCRLIPLLLIAIVVMAGVSNWQHQVVLGTGVQSVSCSLGSIILFSFALGMMTLGLRALDEIWAFRAKLSANNLQKDIAQVTSETAQDKITALENKIKTLETALSKAIKA